MYITYFTLSEWTVISSLSRTMERLHPKISPCSSKWPVGNGKMVQRPGCVKAFQRELRPPQGLDSRHTEPAVNIQRKTANFLYKRHCFSRWCSIQAQLEILIGACQNMTMKINLTYKAHLPHRRQLPMACRNRKLRLGILKTAIIRAKLQMLRECSYVCVAYMENALEGSNLKRLLAKGRNLHCRCPHRHFWYHW